MFTLEIGLVLLILLVAITLFLSDRLRPDLIALLVMSSLVMTGLISYQQAFSSFSNPAVVTVGAIVVISYALFQTGVADMLGERILQVSGHSELRIIAAIMLTVGLMSAFMNNIGATAVLLPAVLGISKQTKIPASKLLIPLSFASLMGGNLTLIGTPPNILASAALRDVQGTGFAFFDFMPMGILIVGVGVTYMLLIGRHILPSYESDDVNKNYQMREYLSEIEVLPDSPLVGKTLIESKFGEKYDLGIVGLIRDCTVQLGLRRLDTIRAHDTLLVKGDLHKILKVQQQQQLRIETAAHKKPVAELTSPDATVAEVMVLTQAESVGKSLREVRFRQQYRMTVLAMWRQKHVLQNALADEPLQPGDVLLVQGKREHLNLLRLSRDFLLLEPVPLEMRRTSKVPITLTIVGLMLVAASMGWLHISMAATLAVIALVLSRVITMDELYQAVEWRAIFFISGMLSLGTAMETTNAAQYLADQLVYWLTGFGPTAILFGLYLLTAALTQLMSNSAATVLIAPIAINVALSLDARPEPFVMTVVVAASTIFLTPVGHASNILVFGPGRYKFTDFTKVGAGLLLIYMVLTLTVLPLIWPL